MGVKKTVWRDPVYGNDRRRAQQYWAKRSELLGGGYMLPTAAELAEWEHRIDSMDRGRVRPTDKDASDVLVWGDDAVLASEICEKEGKLIDEPKDAPGLRALSLECRSDEFLDRYFRSVISK